MLELTRKLDKPKGKSTTSVLKGISDDLEAFYGNVVEHLAGYVAPAPKLPREHAAGAAEAASTGQPVAAPVDAAVDVDRDSTPVQLDAVVQEVGEVRSNDVLAAGAPGEPTQ